ncbi:MAG: DUF192 domain-containing protein [Oligoflexia bacterium]|nr:DUF192 domain-containing protein [Oligoflexia bacterium]
MKTKLTYLFFFFISITTTATATPILDREFKYYEKNPSGKIILTSKKEIIVKIALSADDQILGLSRIDPKKFKDNDALLFFYKDDEIRSFWMPDTHFNLDIIFVDKDLKVLHIERNVAHYPRPISNDGSNIREIPTTKGFFCRHVIEMSATSPLSKEIKVGDTLNWQPKGQLTKL